MSLNILAFKKIEYLLPYSVHKIEERMKMNPKKAKKLYEKEQESERQYWIYYWIKHTQGEDREYWINLSKNNRITKNTI